LSIIGNHREIDSSNHKKRKGGRGPRENSENAQLVQVGRFLVNTL